ncbi:hypothetical protein [Microvirga arsenatis]|uniref:Glycerophosphoryl diester phosphodiesterase membrane domain-containing protein n=1 Tax=Microvirga arsenatis TaxID=2692265 RepID=A0ABW9YY56_9HYPH|nr:hypothetical protein [Microvirga arsenatis]NBJ09391.1 hypothetical protein [Microvirga arsenatis]NBJ23751.1 hypothetical protein [Microvirga arsenatis]
MTQDISSIPLTEAELARAAVTKKRLGLFVLMIYLSPIISLIISAFYIHSQDICCSTATYIMMSVLDFSAPGIADFIRFNIKWKASFRDVFVLIAFNVSLATSLLSLPILFLVIKDLGLEYYKVESQSSDKVRIRHVSSEIMTGIGGLAFGLFMIFIIQYIDASTLSKKNKFNDIKLLMFVPIAFPVAMTLFLCFVMQLKKAALIYRARREDRSDCT